VDRLHLFVAVAETRTDVVAEIVSVVAEFSVRLRRRAQLGVLVRYTKWRRRRCLPCVTAMDAGLPVLVDNGAYEFVSSGLGSIDVARWHEDYARWLETNDGTYTLAVLPDIPATPGGVPSARERRRLLRLSAESQARFVAGFWRRVPVWRMVPVTQGFTISEYNESFDMLAGAGVLSYTAYSSGAGDYRGTLAIGSTRYWSAGAASIEERVAEILDACCPAARRFHLLGAQQALVHYPHPRLGGVDTGAHGHALKRRWRTDLKCDAPNKPDCYRRAVEQLLARWAEVIDRNI